MDDITSREAVKQFKWVRTRPVRPDGVPKVTGLAQYGADLAMPGCGRLHPALAPRPCAHSLDRHLEGSHAARR